MSSHDAGSEMIISLHCTYNASYYVDRISWIFWRFIGYVLCNLCYCVGCSEELRGNIYSFSTHELRRKIWSSILNWMYVPMYFLKRESWMCIFWPRVSALVVLGIVTRSSQDPHLFWFLMCILWPRVNAFEILGIAKVSQQKPKVMNLVTLLFYQIEP